jgi:small subunit ribosomal protein S1
MTTMSESFEDLFRQEDTKKMRRLTPGQKISATIVGISGESVFLDVGGKSEGVMNSAEITGKDGELTKGIGDTVEVYFLKSRSGESVFTARVGSGSNTDHLEEAWRSGIPVEGFVKAEIKGGFEITMGGNIRAFCPFSQMSLRRVTDPALEFIGSHMIFRITRFEENGRNIVVSARAIQEEERARQKELMKTSLQEGTDGPGYGHFDPRLRRIYRYRRNRRPDPDLRNRLEPGGKYRRAPQCGPGGHGGHQKH